MDFTIVTSVVNQINMGKIEEYLKSGSSNCTPGEAFQALDIVLKNRPFALRLVISKSSDNNIFCIIQLKKKV